MTISDKSRERLVMLLGMLGSAHVGEIANAASFAEKIRKEHGLTWDDLIVPSRSAGQRQQHQGQRKTYDEDRPATYASDFWPTLAHALDCADAAKHWAKTPLQTEFVSQMNARLLKFGLRAYMTTKQANWLKAIAGQA